MAGRGRCYLMLSLAWPEFPDTFHNVSCRYEEIELDGSSDSLTKSQHGLQGR